jgi:hypothetical protein
MPHVVTLPLYPSHLAQVIKQDLQLLAQISSSSEESHFKAFMMDLLDLFSTDRRLLENRGSLIIRQLCLNLNTERIYKTFAEILEKEEVKALVPCIPFALIVVPGLGVCQRYDSEIEHHPYNVS